MSKRFTDTDKWKKEFIKGLDAPKKLLWLYILDDCDHAGIWHVELDIARIRLGIQLPTEQEIIKSFSANIFVFDDGKKWFIPDFVRFQYGELNPQNRAHNSVIKRLNDYNLNSQIKPLTSPLQGAKDKDKDKDKDKVVDFYKSEISKHSEMDGIEYYKKFVKTLYGDNTTGEPLESVLKMDQQVSYKQYLKIHNDTIDYGIEYEPILVSMNNWKRLSNNTSVQATLLNWMKREVKA